MIQLPWRNVQCFTNGNHKKRTGTRKSNDHGTSTGVDFKRCDKFRFLRLPSDRARYERTLQSSTYWYEKPQYQPGCKVLAQTFALGAHFHVKFTKAAVI
ncbi:MAG: hypothetical protein DKT66_10030 [Candidatus Melainabacteria bacterium]|nr:MAG: hypothetical protein DKT66_10030 [Candidatus Melainabacteria bacterium]